MTPSYQKRLIERVNKLYKMIGTQFEFSVPLNVQTLAERNYLQIIFSEITALKGFVEALEDEEK